jgi:hypothetical protein
VSFDIRRLALPMACIWAVAAPFFARFTADDSYIVARYAANLVDHGALVYNLGEQVSALTSPLHALLLAALYWATGEPIASYKVVAVLVAIATFGAVLARFRGAPQSFVVAAMLLLASHPLLLWTFGGLETPLLTALVTAMALGASSNQERSARRVAWIVLLGGLAFLTRHDSALFTAPVLFFVLRQARLRGGRVLVALGPLVLPAAWLIAAATYYGDPLPTSFHVKTPSGEPDILLRNGLYVLQYMVILGVVPFALLVISVAELRRRAGSALREQVARSAGLHLGLALALAYALTTAMSHMMWSFRVFTPFIPAVAILAADLMERVAARMPDGRMTARVDRPVALLVAMMIALQGLEFHAAYRYSVDGMTVMSGEYFREGAATYSDSFLPTLAMAATDIRRDWEGRPASADRAPRVRTFAAGLMPYQLREAYIYEDLVSYRRECRYDWGLSADYLHIVAPRHGETASQLPRPEASYELVSRRRIVFNGVPEDFLVFYNPEPQPNRLPPRVDGPCTE